jgi:hypothetical protein
MRCDAMRCDAMRAALRSAWASHACCNQHAPRGMPRDACARPCATRRPQRLHRQHHTELCARDCALQALSQCTALHQTKPNRAVLCHDFTPAAGGGA